MKLALHVHDGCCDCHHCYWSGEGILSLHDEYATSPLFTGHDISHWIQNVLGGWLLAEVTTKLPLSRRFFHSVTLTTGRIVFDSDVAASLLKEYISATQYVLAKYFCVHFLYTREIKSERSLAALCNAQ